MKLDETKTKNREYIKIVELETSNNKLEVKLDFSENISKFFLTNKFAVEYDKNIEDIDKSILVVPPISTIIPIAWATGADVYVQKLDKSYLDSLNEVGQVFRDWFPQFSFSGKIHVQKVISNKFNNNGYALLFSGGVDSLTSYVRHKDKRPTLISIWGADIPLHEYKFWNRVRSRLLNFAEEEGVDIQFIKANIQEIPNNNLLTSEYRVGNWWEKVSYGLILLGLCAPLTTKEIGTIFIASPGTGVEGATNPIVNTNISWGDVKIVIDGVEISRQEKIKILKNDHRCLSYLRVCWSQHLEYNCGYCEKCLRTIVGLILENIDPKYCNFRIKNNILNLVQIYLTKGLLNLTDNKIFMLQDIQKHIPETIVDSEVSRKYKSEKFFRWFKDFDFSNYEYDESKLSQLSKVYLLLRWKGVIYSSKRIAIRISKRLE